MAPRIPVDLVFSADAAEVSGVVLGAQFGIQSVIVGDVAIA